MDNRIVQGQCILTNIADVYTGTLSTSPAAYVDGGIYLAQCSATNTTTTPTVNFNSLGAKTLIRDGAAALGIGDMSGTTWLILLYKTVNNAFHLLNAIKPTPVGTLGTNVTAAHFGDGKNYITILTLTAASLGPPTAATNLAIGALIYTFPAGVHVHTATYMSIGLTVGGVTTDTPDVGIGSVIGSGVVTVLGGTATFEDYITGQTATNCSGTATVKTSVATAGALTGISINEVGGTKTVYLNAADGWDAGVTGNLTATGTVTLKWSRMS